MNASNATAAEGGILPGLSHEKPHLVATLRNLVATGDTDASILRFLRVAQVAEADLKDAPPALAALRREAGKS
jgi:hypothetical protein